MTENSKGLYDSYKDKQMLKLVSASGHEIRVCVQIHSFSKYLLSTSCVLEVCWIVLFIIFCLYQLSKTDSLGEKCENCFNLLLPSSACQPALQLLNQDKLRKLSYSNVQREQNTRLMKCSFQAQLCQEQTVWQ